MTRKTRDDEIIRDILVRIGDSEHVNQRTLAKELGIALGMTNAYIKRCVRKGYIKIGQIPPNRYAYYLTPTGFSEKTRLTAEYLSDSFLFFRRARSQYAAIFKVCHDSGWRDLALAGCSELGEIAILFARDHPVTLHGVIEPARAGERFMGLAVVADAGEFESLDAVVLTSLNAAQQTYDRLTETLAPARVLVPRLLSVDHNGSPSNARAEDLAGA